MYLSMKLGPLGQPGRVERTIVAGSVLRSIDVSIPLPDVDARLPETLVRPDSLRAVVPPGKINRLTSNLCRGKVDEVPSRIRMHFAQSRMQPQHGVLQDIVGRFPPPDSRVVIQHPSSQHP
jgi:hypothetical protein